MSVQLTMRDALIVVDVQKDFCLGGTLEVPDGDAVVPVINSYIKLFQQVNAMIVATRDWHPYNHCSFKEQGGIWPEHCVQNSPGAEFHPGLNLPSSCPIISAADSPDKEAYSGFEGTYLEELLRSSSINRVFVCGLATDYCVRATALDAVMKGFETYLLEDAVRGVNVNPDDSDKAIREMEKNRVRLTIFADLRC